MGGSQSSGARYGACDSYSWSGWSAGRKGISDVDISVGPDLKSI